MRLAAARRAVEDERRRRPGRPGVDPGDRVGVARRDEKVVAAEARAMAEIERELASRRGMFGGGH
jgi:hypothetical protein